MREGWRVGSVPSRLVGLVLISPVPPNLVLPPIYSLPFLRWPLDLAGTNLLLVGERVGLSGVVADPLDAEGLKSKAGRGFSEL